MNYGKCSKIFKHFYFCSLINTCKMLVFRAGNIKKMLVRIGNREDPDQTASSEAV